MKSSGKTKVSDQVVSILGSSQNHEAADAPDLDFIAERWADLPAAIRAGIVATVWAASPVDSEKAEKNTTGMTRG
jgi:hypothetical protein